MGLKFLFLLAFIALIAFIIYQANRNKTNDIIKHENKPPDIIPSDNSLAILNERFASGEINEEEYKKIKDLLTNK